MTEDIEGKYLACRVKKTYAKYAVWVLGNIGVLLIACLFFAVIGLWIAGTVYSSLGLIGVVQIPPDVALLVLMAGLFSTMFSVLLSAVFIFESREEKTHIKRDTISETVVAVATVLLGINIACIFIYNLQSADLAYKIISEIVTIFGISLYAYVAMYNMCEFRLMIAGAGRYSEEEKKKTEEDKSVF